MGCLKLTYDNAYSPLKKIYSSVDKTIEAKAFTKNYFEKENHLGSVRAVVQGNKDANNKAIIVSLSDYSDFGWTMQGRSFVSDNYRFGYQGSEHDAEINNSANSYYTTDFRMMDVRVGKWFMPDPIKHPWESPYASMGNNPIAMTDEMGLEYHSDMIGSGYHQPDACPSFEGGSTAGGFDGSMLSSVSQFAGASTSNLVASNFTPISAPESYTGSSNLISTNGGSSLLSTNANVDESSMTIAKPVVDEYDPTDKTNPVSQSIGQPENRAIASKVHRQQKLVSFGGIRRQAKHCPKIGGSTKRWTLSLEYDLRKKERWTTIWQRDDEGSTYFGPAPIDLKVKNEVKFEFNSELYPDAYELFINGEKYNHDEEASPGGYDEWFKLNAHNIVGTLTVIPMVGPAAEQDKWHFRIREKYYVRRLIWRSLRLRFKKTS